MKIIHFTLFTLLLGCGAIKSQNIERTVQGEILDFFVSKGEIEIITKDKILKNFEGLVTISELKDSVNFTKEVSGIYQLSLNITHTKSHILIYNNEQFLVLDIDNLDNIIVNVLKFFKKNLSLTKDDYIKYLEEILAIRGQNTKIRNLNKIGNRME